MGPKGIAVDPGTGRIYVADTGNGRLQRLSSDGTPDTTWPLPPPLSTAPAAPTQTPVLPPAPPPQGSQ